MFSVETMENDGDVNENDRSIDYNIEINNGNNDENNKPLKLMTVRGGI